LIKRYPEEIAKLKETIEKLKRNPPGRSRTRDVELVLNCRAFGE